MSWPQWPNTNVPQSGIAQPVINPAPNVNASAAPTSQYTAEQWAQMQHQNWQQWVQWQQQFQLWQQQYGAEYQKSMNAIAQTGVPTQPPPSFMNVPPPPAETTKPPPPPDEPLAPPTPTATFTLNVPPPVTPANYTTAPPPQLPNANPTFDSKLLPNRNNPPPTTTNNFSQYDVNNQQKFNRNQNYNRGPNVNWQNQNQNRNQPLFNRFSQPPPVLNENENKFEIGMKRPGINVVDNDNSKRNKVETNETKKQETNPPARWGEGQPKNTADWAASPSVPANNNTEELSEPEKKFDKQFHDWEAQFQKWKQQNANHPDKEQYREYEKKWETWRSQLLERREQMKRKRLGLTNTLGQLGDKLQKKPEPESSLNLPFVQQSQVRTESQSDLPNTGIQTEGNKVHDVTNQIIPEVTQNVGSKSLNMEFLRPPPTLNNQPLEFKKANESFGVELPNDNIENSNIDAEGCDFLKSSSSGGIPGLDLVKDSAEVENTKESLPVNENPKPDLEAISRGINSILGDQKFMNMLSLVSQNQNQNRSLTAAVPSTVDSPKFSPTDYQQEEYDDFESEHLKFEQLDAANSNTFEHLSRDSGCQNKLNLDITRENSNRGGASSAMYQKDRMDTNRNFGQLGNNERTSLFNKNMGNFPENDNEFRSNEFDRENVHSKRDFPNFNKGFDSFNRSSSNNGQISSTMFRSANDWNQGSDNRGVGNNYKNTFNSESGNFPKNIDHFNRDLDISNDPFIRRPPNFNRGPEVFNRGSDNFNRAPMPFNRDAGNSGFQNFDRYQKNQNFGTGPNKFNQDCNTFNRNIPNFNERGPFDREKLDNGPGKFNTNMNSFNIGGNFNKGGNLQNKAPLMPRNSDLVQQRSNVSTDDSNRFSNREFNLPRDLQKSGRINEDFTRKPDFNKMHMPMDNFSTNLNNKPQNALNFEGSGRSPNTFSNKSEDFSKCTYSAVGNRNRNVSNIRNDDISTRTREPQTNPTEKDNFNRASKTPPSNTDVTANVTSQADESEGDQGIWKTKTVVDYDHKSLLSDDLDIILEPFYTFDYRNKPLNRIPYPSRPKWLTEMISKYPEFDLATSRNSRPIEYRSYPTKSRFDSYYKYEDRGRKSYDDRNRRPLDDFDRKAYDDRGRKFSDDKDRRSFDNRNRKAHDDKERRSYDDRDRKFYEEKVKPSEDNVKFDNNKSTIDYEDERAHTDDKLFDSNFDDFEDEEFDFDNSDTLANQKGETEQDNKQSAQNNEQMTIASTSKSNVLLIEDILSPPGRFTRPPQIVIILRGPPGSGKSFLAKLIKDKEIENGGSAPRILCLDDYFMVEQEKEVEEDGRRVKVKEMVYEYEEDMEGIYRQSLMKSFKKTITDGYFNFIIVDNVNDKVKYFGEMWSFAKQNGFQVYICQMELDVQICTKRNIHGRSESEIEKCVAGWEHTPSHHPVVDATSLIQSGSISEVEMEEINSPSSENLNEEERLIASKWDNFDYSNDNLAKLDGTNKPLRPNRTMEDYLQLDDDWVQPVSSKPGQKRVRWADLEERKQQEKMRAIGFVVGQTNWDRMMDPTMGSSALTQTKYIERYSKY
ncbi:hypothetical protein RN001_003297 [Aquatica leii]|uniref:YLP motif-containing protein 1 n=1 Tax=Aquatica leii TaxID=1421715 RepID=A0AAN7SDV7_9COLE|nr:hypothetical protein RN001_003297 [Aquatica leii]